MMMCSGRRKPARCRCWLTLLALCVTLSACGQIGPLYLPAETPADDRSEQSAGPADTPTVDSNREDREEDESD